MRIVPREIDARCRAVVRWSREFGERGRDAPMGSGFHAEFVKATSDVLHERVTAHDDAGGVIGV
jgi:hypothetical protein